MAALNMAAREHPDLVLVDVHRQAEATGLAAAKEIQERFEVPGMADFVEKRGGPGGWTRVSRWCGHGGWRR